MVSAILIILIILAIIFLFGYRKNLSVSHYQLISDRIPKSFDNFKIVQLSDLHGTCPKELTETVSSLKPDLVVCTGDIFDGVHGFNITTDLLPKLSAIAPVSFVSGNHEAYLPPSLDWRAEVEKAGIHLVDDREEFIERDGQKIRITGITSPLLGKKCWKKRQAAVRKKAEAFNRDDLFTICLFHRANDAHELEPAGFDLVLSGHLHGGQWRIFGKGIASPGVSKRVDLFYPETGGIYPLGQGRLIVSRGLGDRMIIPRLYNPPEVVEITLQSKG